MFTKINVNLIVCDHIQSIRNEETGRADWSDVLVFLISPIAAAILFIWLFRGPSRDVIELFVTAFAIFTALLFNLLLLLYDITRKETVRSSHDGGPTKQERVARTLLGQIFSNTSFLVLLSVGIVLVSIWTYVIHPHDPKEPIVGMGLLVVGMLYWWIALFLVTILMVLKRIHALLRTEF